MFSGPCLCRQPTPAKTTLCARVAARFGSLEGGRIQERCSGNRRFIAFEITGTRLSGGIVRVEGDHVTAGTVDHGVVHELPLSQIYDASPKNLWDAVEGMRPLLPSRVTRDDLTMLPIDQDEVQFAVCEGGRFWVAVAASPDRQPPSRFWVTVAASPDRNSAPGRAAGLFLLFFLPPPPPPHPVD